MYITLSVNADKYITTIYIYNICGDNYKLEQHHRQKL